MLKTNSKLVNERIREAFARDAMECAAEIILDWWSHDEEPEKIEKAISIK